MTQSQRVEVLSPVGRLVSGDPFTPRTTDQNGAALVTKTGPNAGKPRSAWEFGVAFDKNDPAWPAFYATIDAEAKRAFPQMFDAQGNCLHPKFSWKVTDGDSQVPNGKLRKPCDNEGWPGHWIVFFSSGFATTVFNTGGQTQITDPNALKRGYYVRVFAEVSGNNNKDNPGVYIGHKGLEFIAYGEEIQGSFGIDGASVFGGAAAGFMPAGASTTPLAAAPTTAETGAAVAQQPVAQQPVAQQPVAQQPVAQQPVAQQPVAQQPVAQQPVAQQPAASVQPVAGFTKVETMRIDSAGNAHTEAALRAAGWSEESIQAAPIAQ